MEKQGYEGKGKHYEYTNLNSENQENQENSASSSSISRPRKKLSKKAKGIIIAALIILGGGIFIGSCSTLTPSDPGYMSEFDFGDEYIGNLHLEGTITEGNSGDGYNHQWILDRIEQMKADTNNYGMIITVDTPGGSVYATDEVYHALLKYKEETSRPVYVYMGNIAASGGYYISMAADKIYANPNCWTGSIGVIVGTIYDFSGLMDELGIKAVDITSGANKAMGSPVKPLTEEQKEIYQSLVDDAFSRFVGVVSKGRNMSEEQVRKIADGRVYTATQARDLGLIDSVSSFETASRVMQEECDLKQCNIYDIAYTEETSLFESIFGIKANDLVKNEYTELFELIDKNSKFTVSYLSQIQK